MIFWLDAQLPPNLAPWLTQAFGVEAYSLRYIELIEQRGTPPRMLWVTCGNLTNRRLREVFGSLFIDAIALLEAGEQIVELGDA